MASFGAKFDVTTQCTLKDKQFERVTLGRIKHNTLDGDLILYFHSKGAFGLCTAVTIVRMTGCPAVSPGHVT